MGYDGGTLERGRALALTRMTETVRAGRFEMTTNPATGKPVRTLTALRYEGVAEVKYPSLVVSGREVASQQVVSQSVIVKIPIGNTMLLEGDEIDVTASTADASLIGRTYRVTGTPQSGKVTSHRYPVEEQT